MSVIRVVHNRENPFVLINKSVVNDPNLSLKAVGLWTRCMSRPNDWHFSVKEIASNSKEGKNAIYTIINELIEAGYVLRLENGKKGEDGKFYNRVVEYVFFEFVATEEDKKSIEEEFKKRFRDSGFGDLGNRDLPIRPILNTEVNLSKETKYRKELISPPTPSRGNAAKAASGCEISSSSHTQSQKTTQTLVSHGEHVKLTQEEFDDLCSKYGSAVIKDLIEQINDYLLSSGRKPYKNYAATIRQWLRRRKENPNRSYKTAAETALAKHSGIAAIERETNEVVEFKGQLFLGMEVGWVKIADAKNCYEKNGKWYLKNEMA